MIRVKICGIKREEDAKYAIKAGASALGFIFSRRSPRYIPPVKASDLVRKIPPFVDRVGVFVDMNLQGILNIIRRVGLSVIQLHGNESPEFCLELKTITSIPIIKAFRVKDIESLKVVEKYYCAINGVLLDTFDEKLVGGTGKTFDWNLSGIIRQIEVPIIISGGLNPSNIKRACEVFRPYAIDVNSGVEISAGIKDHEKIKQLFDNLIGNNI